MREAEAGGGGCKIGFNSNHHMCSHIRGHGEEAEREQNPLRNKWVPHPIFRVCFETARSKPSLSSKMADPPASAPHMCEHTRGNGAGMSKSARLRSATAPRICERSFSLFHGSRPPISVMLRGVWNSLHWSACKHYKTYLSSDNSFKLPITDKIWPGQVKRLHISIFDISKIRQKKIIGWSKAQKYRRCLWMILVSLLCQVLVIISAKLSCWEADKPG